MTCSTQKTTLTFTIEHAFPWAFLSGSIDHLLDNDARRNALGNITRHLTTDGRIVLEIYPGGMQDSPAARAFVKERCS